MAESTQSTSPPRDLPRLSPQPNKEIFNSKICAEGDVILMISERTKITRLRVSSLILSSASPVFKAMLGPHFAEGQQSRSAQNPTEVSVEDDDVPSLIWLCKILHHQYKHKPSLNYPSAAARLYRLTVVADKYFCLDAIQLAGAGLLGRFATSSVLRILPLKSITYLIAASERFRHRRYFALFTRRLIMDYVPNTAPYRKLSGSPALQLLPKSFLDQIEEQRHRAWVKLHARLKDLSESTTFRSVLNQELCGHPGHWPEHVGNYDLTLREIIDRTCHCGDISIPGARFPVSSTSLSDVAHQSNWVVRGLCLACLGRNGLVKCQHVPDLRNWVEDDTLS